MPVTDYTFQYTCRLCQQAPLLQFQHRQEGVTLRGSQVKPALTRYLLRQHGDAPVPPTWAHRPGQLDFRLRLEAAEPPQVLTVGPGTPYELFYANGYTPNDRQAVVGDCLMTITCFEPTLMAFIKAHLPGFFAVTGFGALKSKGFGSYLPEGTDLSPAEVAGLLREHLGATTCCYFDFTDRQTVFRQIHTVYRLIKGGIHTAPRRRSLLYTYMDEVCGFDHERTMMVDAGVVTGVTRRRHPEGRFVRALLGLTDGYRFGNGPASQRVSVRPAAGNTLRRVESPLLFKVIGHRVYLAALPLCEELYGARFTFRSKDTGRETTLAVPTREELGEDFTGRFLSYCATRLSGEDNRLRLYPETADVSLTEVAI